LGAFLRLSKEDGDSAFGEKIVFFMGFIYFKIKRKKRIIFLKTIIFFLHTRGIHTFEYSFVTFTRKCRRQFKGGIFI